MSKIETDQYFSNLWVVLTSDQKKSLLGMIKSFAEKNEMNSSEGRFDLNEARVDYAVPMNLFQSLKKKQRKAFLSFLEASGVESLGEKRLKNTIANLKRRKRNITGANMLSMKRYSKSSKRGLGGNTKSEVDHSCGKRI